MCGIVGYIGKRQAYPLLIKGLHRLEYRGYDSAGCALIEDGELNIYKAKGKVADLEAVYDKTNSPGKGTDTVFLVRKRRNDGENHRVFPCIPRGAYCGVVYLALHGFKARTGDDSHIRDGAGGASSSRTARGSQGA